MMNCFSMMLVYFILMQMLYRNDLANIVRRRGYKIVRELLANSTKLDHHQPSADEKLTATSDSLTGLDEKVSNVVEEEPSLALVSYSENSLSNLGDGVGLDSDDDYIKENIVSTLTSQEKNVFGDIALSTSDPIGENDSRAIDADPDLSPDDSGMPVESSSTLSLEENPSYMTEVPTGEANDMVEYLFSSTTASTVENYSEGPNDSLCIKPDDACIGGESLRTSTLEEKVANFIQNGDLDMLEGKFCERISPTLDNVYSMLSEHTEESEELVERQDELGIQSRTDEEPFRHDCSSMMNAGLMLNGSIFQPKDVTSIATLTDSHRDDYPKAEDAGVDKDLNVETIRRENQIEINHLKFLLHQKELELTKLKEQIEKEKLALSDLQTKAETEINKAQKLISEKDAELHAAEESLSGLKEVEIQYCGDGETVEVAGSFNGWYHRIKLDPQTSSITESIGSRCWSTVLWLYSGTYEIKFIIDGQWRTDPERESVSRGYITNNILRVAR
ncbi:uncharacterized protein LOC110810734 isoform X2 [Carica papaya]|uniref:uncharacterized protein LOC110810734 isoform X2 n=1 Tax=Carica papaya TaxID=3649 RepID=UPI000B8D1509|nr:uncharacterized protein LOC110810734 isoform X2 [Carica papaya]